MSLKDISRLRRCAQRTQQWVRWNLRSSRSVTKTYLESRVQAIAAQPKAPLHSNSAPVINLSNKPTKTTQTRACESQVEWEQSKALRPPCSIEMNDQRQIKARNGHLFTVSHLSIRILFNTSLSNRKATLSPCKITKTFCVQVLWRVRKEAMVNTQICSKINKCQSHQLRSGVAGIKSWLKVCLARVHTSNLVSNRMPLLDSFMSVSGVTHLCLRIKTCLITDSICQQRVRPEGQVRVKVTEIVNFST